MTRRRRDTIASGAALLVVAAMTISPAGADLRRAFAAREAARVDGIAASLLPRANALVPLDPSARLRRSTIRPGTGVRGRRGDVGPVGSRGPRGAPGGPGPGQTRQFRNDAVFGPYPDGFEVNVATAAAVAPGTWMVLGSVKLRRESGGEFLADCRISNGLSVVVGTQLALGADSFGTGMQEATSVVTAVFQSELPQDLTLTCNGARFGPAGSGVELYDPQLIIARLPAASARIRGS